MPNSPWGALAETLKTCTSEVSDGKTLTYSRMSSPKAGQASLAVRPTIGDVTVLQHFALVGPVMVSTGEGGLVNSDADLVADALTAQVKRYLDAAVP